MGYIRAHWRGEHSLARSYWINGTLLGVLIGVTSAVLAQAVEAVEMPTRPSPIRVALVALGAMVWVGVSVWQLVGIWRSATRHKNDTGRHVWATVAQAMVVFWWIGTAGFTYDFGKLISANIQAMAGWKFAEYHIEVTDTAIRFSGYVNFDVVDEIRDLLSSNENIKVLVISSPGGYVGAAVELGNLVEQYELNVVAAGRCSSGCTLPLVASPNPMIVPGTVVGFHRAGGLGVTESDEESARLMDEFYRDHGVDLYVRTKAMSTPLEKMWTPSLRELVEHGIIKYVFNTEGEQFVEAGEWCATRPSDC